MNTSQVMFYKSIHCWFISAFQFQDGMVSKLQWLSFWWGHVRMIFSVRICLSITKHSFLWKEIFMKPGNGLKWLFWFSMKTRTSLKFGWLVMGRVIIWMVLALFPSGMVTSWPGDTAAPESQSTPSLLRCWVMESANILSLFSSWLTLFSCSCKGCVSVRRGNGRRTEW